MFSLTSSHRYYMFSEPTDMRKSFDGLCGLVNSQLQLDPSNGGVFVFINKRRDRIKLLHWEQGGFVPENEHFLLQKKHDSLAEDFNKLQHQNAYLEQELAQLKRMIFGSKSERFKGMDPEQLTLGC